MGRPRLEVAESPPASELQDFTDVYAAYFGFVWRCLRGLGVAERQLDDAAQDVFVAVHRKLSEFRAQSSLRTWLYGIVRNVAANARRSERRKRWVALDVEPASAGPGPQEHAQDREAAQFVASFVAQLDDKKRDVFVLALIEQMPVPELAETLAIPLNTAYTRLRSVRQEFSRALAQKERSRE